MHQISILTPEYGGTPLIWSPMGEKNMAVLTRVFGRKSMAILPGGQKKWQ